MEKNQKKNMCVQLNHFTCEINNMLTILQFLKNQKKKKKKISSKWIKVLNLKLFLATVPGLWDLNSPTGDQTPQPAVKTVSSD